MRSRTEGVTPGSESSDLRLRYLGPSRGFKLLVYLVTSVDDFRDVAIAAVTHSSVALWILPALVLMSAHNSAKSALGILLVANTGRALIARRAPQKQGQSAPAGHGLGSTWFIVGALFLQLAFCAWWWDYPLLSAGCLTCSVCLWTLAFFGNGGARPVERVNLTRSLVSILLTVVVATALTAAEMDAERKAAKPMNLAGTSREIAERFGNQGKPGRRAWSEDRSSHVTNIQISNGVPGVILRPEQLREKKSLTAANRMFRFGVARPMSFRFTGEYHVFPVSAESAPRDSALFAGTPLNQVYATVSGALVATEAFQKLEPPFDFSGYKAVQLMVRIQEELPVGAQMQLLGSNTVEDLGTEIFNLPRASEQTIGFAIRRSGAIGQINGIRIIFRRIPGETSHSARVEISGFGLVPR